MTDRPSSVQGRPAEPPKAAAGDLAARFREIVADPLNLLIRRHPRAGLVERGMVTLHNGHRVPLAGEGSYYGAFSQILVINRGVHEPLEEYAFQLLLPHLPPAPSMIELGAYWGHYSMWLKQARPQADLCLVEPEPAHLAAGRANLARHGHAARFVEERVGQGGFALDAHLAATGAERITLVHADIQGAETEMLEGASGALAGGRVDYWFVSTHSQALHLEVRTRLEQAGYRIEVAADFDRETTSFDGFILAAHPERPKVWTGPPPLGRAALARAEPARVLARLRALSGQERG